MTGTASVKKVWYLRRIDLFAGLTDEEIEEVARLLDDHAIPAGAELLRDRRRDRVYVVKEGVVRLYAGQRPRQVTLALLGPGRLFGLSATVGRDDPALGASTLEPSYICFATWPKLLETFARHPQVLLQLTRSLAEQVFLTESWVARFRTTAPRARLADLLLELSREFGEPSEGGRRIRFRLTQEDLAAMVGLSRETANRLLGEFARAGWLAREAGRLIVRDHRALEALARGGGPAAARHESPG